MSSCDNLFNDFLSDWNVPGMTVAISQNGRLVYERAFGYANQGLTEVTQPYHRFRVASCSKPITSITIMQLIQSGQLHLTDLAFGPTGIIKDTFYTNSIADSRMYAITVQHLLEHTAGWDRNISCDGYSGCDPISFPLHVTSVFNAPNPAGDSLLIKFLLTKTLNYNPGATYAYSNIGYLILGKIIEHVTGSKYDDYLAQNIFAPLGICDIELGKNLLAAKLEREGEYIATGNAYSCYGNGQLVPWQYGGFNIEAMNAHGGWIATARDLVKLLAAVDGFSTKPDILSPSTIQTMVTPSTVFSNYAKGWSVNSFNNWWHTGSLDGSASFTARTAGGYCWAIIMNSRSVNSNAFWTALDQLPWNCIGTVSTWPAFDLTAPVTNSSSTVFTSITNQSTTLTCTPGNGNKRLVVCRQGTAVNAFPVDGVVYTANSSFSAGADLGGGNYAVYYGAGNSVPVTNLVPNTDYYFRIFEVSENSTTGNNAVYLMGCSADNLVHTTCNGNPPLTPSVTVSVSPAATICAGTNLTFTALPVNGGMLPSYQWKKNGANINGATLVNYSSASLVNGDIITLNMTSNDVCAWPITATSNSVTIVVPANGGTGIWTWLGGINSDWFNPCNWDRNCLPNQLSDILVPGNLTNYPTIAAGVASCNTIEIDNDNGAAVTINTTTGARLNVVHP